MGGDWNCMVDFTIDRSGEEPHPPSAVCLARLLKEFDLLDVWRTKHRRVRQYTWLKISSNIISAARLDRFYVSSAFNNRVMECFITPVGLTNHNLVVLNASLASTQRNKTDWHFNTKLLKDVFFCEQFVKFWEQ